MANYIEIIEDWELQGQYFNHKGYKIWYADFNSDCLKTICVLHGYPTCSYDFKNIVKYFPNHRIILHDHLGFGFSDKPFDSKYLLTEQADIALALYEYLKLNDVLLLAHDYGTSVATEIIARDNEKALKINIERFVLSNGSMLINLSQLRPIQRLLKSKIGPLVVRFVSFQTFKSNMQRIWFDAYRLEESELRIMWEFLNMNSGRKVLPTITKYIDQRYLNYDRWIGGIKETHKPVLILWGESDPVAVVQMAHELEKLIQFSTKVILSKVGHYPMIESSEKFYKSIQEFI